MNGDDIRDAVEALLRTADKAHTRGQEIKPTGVRLAIAHLRAVVRSAKRKAAERDTSYSPNDGWDFR